MVKAVDEPWKDVEEAFFLPPPPPLHHSLLSLSLFVAINRPISVPFTAVSIRPYLGQRGECRLINPLFGGGF